MIKHIFFLSLIGIYSSDIVAGAGGDYKKPTQVRRLRTQEKVAPQLQNQNFKLIRVYNRKIDAANDNNEALGFLMSLLPALSVALIYGTVANQVQGQNT